MQIFYERTHRFRWLVKDKNLETNFLVFRPLSYKFTFISDIKKKK